jgi:hypothetical protein
MGGSIALKAGGLIEAISRRRKFRRPLSEQSLTHIPGGKLKRVAAARCGAEIMSS